MARPLLRMAMASQSLRGVAICAQGHGTVPAGPRLVRGAHRHGTVADAARPLSLFDRCTRRIVHHPRRLSDFVLTVWPRLWAVSFLRELGCATAKAGKSGVF